MEEELGRARTAAGRTQEELATQSYSRQMVQFSKSPQEGAWTSRKGQFSHILNPNCQEAAPPVCLEHQAPTHVAVAGLSRDKWQQQTLLPTHSPTDCLSPHHCPPA
jgi:hypothetical protein